MKVVLYKIYFTFYKQIRLLVTSPSGEEKINVPQTRLISSEKMTRVSSVYGQHLQNDVYGNQQDITCLRFRCNTSNTKGRV